MLDCNGYSQPIKPKHRSNFMAAYPAGHSLTVDRSQGASYRDYNVYATFPRNQWNHEQDAPHESEVLHGSDKLDQQALRSILRNRNEYTPVNTVNHIMDDSCETIEDSESDVGIGRKSPRGRNRGFAAVFDCYLRPMVAEFLSVLFAVFVVTLVEATLQELKIMRVFRITIISVVEGTCVLVCMGTFQAAYRVHVNPGITLGALFAGGTKPLLCASFWTIQVVAATLGVFLYQVVTINGPPVLPSLLHSNGELWLTGMYKGSSTISCAMLVMAYLSRPRCCDISRNGTESSDIFAISGAVVLASFVSLLSSRASWNPAKTLGTCLAATLQGSEARGEIWRDHYAFWLGPIIGSLFASFFYRLVFADGDHRITSCCTKGRINRE